MLFLHEFATTSPNFVLSIIHRFIVLLSKRYKSCLFWSLLWDLYFYGLHRDEIVFSLVNLSVNLIIRPAKEPRKQEGKSFLPLQILFRMLKCDISVPKLWAKHKEENKVLVTSGGFRKNLKASVGAKGSHPHMCHFEMGTALSWRQLRPCHSRETFTLP